MISSSFNAYMLLIFCVIFTSAIAQRQLGQCCEEYCFDADDEKPQLNRFASKSAYPITKGPNSRRLFVVPNCNPVKFWFISRHGTRLPHIKTVPHLRELVDLRDKIIDNYEKRKTRPDYGALCDEDIKILKKWNYNPNITDDNDQLLTAEGWEELKYLARNYQAAFPNVLENVYTPEKFRFGHTHTQRAEASFQAFAEGLFRENSEPIQIPHRFNPDLLLTPYESCQAYKDNEARRKEPDSESSKFESSDTFKQTIYEISARLGFKFPLKITQISAIWDMCRFDLAWNSKRTSSWCIAFTPNHVKVLEYHQDLKYYYMNGYGNALNTRLACSLVEDMLTHLESQTMPKVVAYFAHSATIQLLFTALGAVKDTDGLRADNYQQLMQRKWRSSKISTFASNLAVIKYDCPHDNERNKIMFLLNQKPLDFNWCNDGLCDWSKVQQMYSSFRQQDCSATYCTVGSASSIVPVLTVILFAVVAGSLFQLVI